MAGRKKKKKKGILRTVFFTLIALIAVAAGTYYITDYYYRPAFIRYREFGVSLPGNYSIHGIDVSRYQASVGWQQVADMKVKDVKIGFAFIKATEGVDAMDPYFRRNWAGAAAAGIPRGAYHFFTASRSGKAQAGNFLEMVKLKKGDLRPVLDIEQTNGTPKQVLQQRVADWLEAVEKVYRVKPIIYTNADFYNNFLLGRFDNYPLWVAHYFVKDKPRITREWHFWQHNEKGRVDGITSFVDFNVFKGDSTEFRDLLIP